MRYYVYELKKKVNIGNSGRPVASLFVIICIKT